jgi:hypothetical protein
VIASGPAGLRHLRHGSPGNPGQREQGIGLVGRRYPCCIAAPRVEEVKAHRPDFERLALSPTANCLLGILGSRPFSSALDCHARDGPSGPKKHRSDSAQALDALTSTTRIASIHGRLRHETGEGARRSRPGNGQMQKLAFALHRLGPNAEHRRLHYADTISFPNRYISSDQLTMRDRCD